ncbi:MAG: hypothetical protein ACP5QS_01675, partial [bacterium]
ASSFIKLTLICLLVSFPFSFFLSHHPLGKGMKGAITEIGLILVVIIPLYLLFSSVFRCEEWEFIKRSLLRSRLKKREG